MTNTGNKKEIWMKDHTIKQCHLTQAPVHHVWLCLATELSCLQPKCPWCWAPSTVKRRIIKHSNVVSSNFWNKRCYIYDRWIFMVSCMFERFRQVQSFYMEKYETKGSRKCRRNVGYNVSRSRTGKRYGLQGFPSWYRNNDTCVLIIRVRVILKIVCSASV